MDKETVTLIAAIIAAVVAIFNAVMNSRRQAELELVKWQRAREDERGRWLQQRRDLAEEKLRLSIVELARVLAVGVQMMTWMTWKAEHDAASLKASDLKTYDADFKALCPQIVSAHMLVVAHHRQADAALKVLIDRLYDLDGNIAKAAILIQKKARAEGIAALRELFPTCDVLHRDLLEKLADIAAPRTDLFPRAA